MREIIRIESRRRPEIKNATRRLRFADARPQSSYFSGFVSDKNIHTTTVAAAPTTASGTKPMCGPKC
jgi:hypothetical protein